jgi:steroid delta-isomerase-like uncharacterized protein
MSDQNKARTRDLYVNIAPRGQMDRLRQVVADDCFDHAAEAMGWENGFLDHIVWVRGVFPDMVVEVTDMVAEDDRVVAYWTLTGTQREEIFGVPPTGEKVTLSAISQLRWRDGQLVEYQVRPDIFSYYQQLGLIPAPSASMAGRSDYRDKIEHFYQDAVVKGDLTAVDDVIHSDFVYHGFAPIGPGPEGMKTYIRDGLAGASDIEAEIEEFFAEGNRAAARLRIAVSHTGELLGAPATGKRLEVMNHCTYRFKDGKIIEEWDTTEDAKMLTILGLLPEPPG